MVQPRIVDEGDHSVIKFNAYDGVIVMADGTVLALDVVVVGTGDKALETARRKRFGWGSLGALERAKRARAATWERVRLAKEDGSMGRREAEEERQKAAGRVRRIHRFSDYNPALAAFWQ